MSAFSGS